MSSPIRQTIEQDMRAALKAGEKQRLSALRLCLNAIKQYEIDERVTVDDDKVTVVLRKLAKQRRASIVEYEKAGREDLVRQETFELDLIHNYLPQSLSSEAMEQIVAQVITETGATALRDMGKVMALLRQRVGANADMAVLSSLVKERLK